MKGGDALKCDKLSKKNAIKIIDDQKVIIEAINRVENSPLDTFEDKICQKYVMTQNVSEIAEWLNSEGHRIGERKYKGKDITNIITTSQSKLKPFAEAFFNFNNTVANGTRNYSKAIKQLRECIGYEDLST